LHLSLGHSHDHHHGHGHDEGDDHGHVHPQEKVSDDTPETACLSATFDHDSDAIYIAQTNGTLGRASAVSQLSFASICICVEVVSDHFDRQCLHRSNQIPDQSAGLPIYLLIASLRL
jgi:hypothetical protein